MRKRTGRKKTSRVRKRRTPHVIGDLELDGDDEQEFDPLEGDGPDGPGDDPKASLTNDNDPELRLDCSLADQAAGAGPAPPIRD